VQCSQTGALPTHPHTHTPATTTPPPQELEEASSQDIEELQAALEEANEHIAQLEQQGAQLQGAQEQASKWVAAAAELQGCRGPCRA
jgi:flagellar biosynthesis/type III secretory pathway protein FliH